MLKVLAIVGRILLVLILSIVIFGFVCNIVDRAKTEKLKKAIYAECSQGTTYSEYRTALYDKFDFYYVEDWEKSDKTPNGRSVAAVSQNMCCTWDFLIPFEYDLFVTGEFTDDQRLQTITIQRRVHGF
ncbi:MAG: hypothetical protein H7Y38_09150 [Armatimonadetes bacterium]|nr:hypothetical protein [Armatimonadota bacterium]